MHSNCRKTHASGSAGRHVPTRERRHPLAEIFVARIGQRNLRRGTASGNRTTGELLRMPSLRPTLYITDPQLRRQWSQTAATTSMEERVACARTKTTTVNANRAENRSAVNAPNRAAHALPFIVFPVLELFTGLRRDIRRKK